MARKEPFKQEGIEKLKKAIKNNEREPLSDNYSKSLRDLVDYCLILD
jgi:hypothetical protein